MRFLDPVFPACFSYFHEEVKLMPGTCVSGDLSSTPVLATSGRYARYWPPVATSRGILRLMTPKKTTLYWVEEITANQSREFILEPIDYSGDAYYVSLGHTDGAPGGCTCLGHKYRGNRVQCKHIAALETLIKAGKIHRLNVGMAK